MRAFLAIDLPQEVRSGIGAFVQDARREFPGWRWTASPLHVTLRFLGEVNDRFLERAAPRWREELARCIAPVFRLSGLGVFPGPRSPRVLWIGIEEEGDAGTLEKIVRCVETVCVAEGLAPEPRAFRPHLTLARAGHAGRVTAPSGALGLSWGPVRPDAVTLFRSTLRPGGADHTALDRFRLETRA